MVKRGKSYESESWNENLNTGTPGLFGQIVSKTVSILGIGTFGLSVFKYNEYPFHFYSISLAFSFIIYLSSLYLILKVSKNLKLENVIGTSSYCGSGSTYFTVFAIFSALITMSSICFSLSIRILVEVLDILSNRLKTWVVSLVLGSLSVSTIVFISKRDYVYSWAKYILAALFITLTVFKLYFDWDSFLEETSTSLKIPFQISLNGSQEFLTVVGITLLSLFSNSICDPSILKNQNNIDTDTSTKMILANLFSSVIGFICFVIIFATSKGALFSGFFGDSIFSNMTLRVFIGTLLIFSILIQCFEYFDRAHNLITDFFLPSTQDKMKKFSSVSFRKIVLILLMFSISYFIYGSDGTLKSYSNAMIYVFCLALSIPFLIIPSYAMITKNRKTSGNFSFANFIAYFMTGTTGIIILISCIFGLLSIQNPRIFTMMIENFKYCIITLIASVLIYALGLICDTYFYPPKPSPINHRNINFYESPEYGKSYIAEVLVLICIFTTFSPPVQSFLSNTSDNFFASSALFVCKSVLRMFIHIDIVHLFFNCLFLYKVGKELASKIGTFHFLSFFLTAGLLSEIFDNVFTTHSYLSNSYMGLGASGINLALLSKYFFDEGSIFKLHLFPVTGHEFMILSIFLDIFFHLTMLLPVVSHSAHLAGTIFGIFFWEYSDKIWTLRNIISKRLLSSKK